MSTDHAHSDRQRFLHGDTDAGPRMLAVAGLLAAQGLIWLAIGIYIGATWL